MNFPATKAGKLLSFRTKELALSDIYRDGRYFGESARDPVATTSIFLLKKSCTHKTKNTAEQRGIGHF